MKIKILLCFALLLTLRGSARSQVADTLLKKVALGEKVPGYALTKLINYPKPFIKLTEFKNKVLVLDFWSSTCVACLESWPKLLALQEKYKDEIVIVLVDPTEGLKKVIETIATQEKIHGFKMSLPIAYGDQQIMRLFPHAFLPHVIFIDKDQRVRYITKGYELNEHTIESIINNRTLYIPEKTDNYVIDPFMPLFTDGNIGNNDIGKDLIWTSLITPYSPEIISISSIESHKTLSKSVGFIGNYALKDMFRILYGKNGDLRLAIPNSRVRFEHVDTNSLVLKLNNAVRQQNRFTIQVVASKYIEESKLKKKMISDLELYFGLKTFMGRQKKMCLVISRSKFPIAQYNGGEKKQIMDISTIHVNGVTMEEFADQLALYIPSFYTMPYPIVDETEYTGKLGVIHFKETGKVLDYDLVSTEILKYGLKFSLQEREVEVLTITGEGQAR